MLEFKLKDTNRIGKLFNKLAAAYETLSVEEKDLLQEVFPLSISLGSDLFKALETGHCASGTFILYRMHRLKDFDQEHYIQFLKDEGLDEELAEAVKEKKRRDKV